MSTPNVITLVVLLLIVLFVVSTVLRAVRFVSFSARNLTGASSATYVVRVDCSPRSWCSKTL